MLAKRAKSLGIVCFCLFFLLSLRLVYISVRKGESFETMAQNQQKKSIAVKNIRAKITDRNGICFTDRNKEQIYLSQNAAISRNETDSIYSFDIIRREPDLARHLIGYTSDNTGISGIESLYNDFLKDKGNINLEYMADASGKPVDSFKIISDTGDDKSSISLTLDYHIQKIAENVMDKYIPKGAVVIIDTESFDILAMASRPNYKSDKIESYRTSSDGELLNRALMSYNAGSVFKIITTSAALKHNPDIKDSYFNCRGKYTLNKTHSFSCHLKDGHGILSLDDAFSFSCNCAFYAIGLETGGNAITDTAADFGLGKKLLNSALGESEGNLPVRPVYPDAETLNLSIGQGELLITPVQCAVVAATIASGGIRKDVNIAGSYSDADGNVQNVRNTGVVRVIDQSGALLISQMMRECVLHGTAKAASGSSVSIAGKTGSAETGWLENGVPLVHGWFCGFFPFESPKYAMAILCEGGNSGADSCVTPFVEIAEQINEIYSFKQ